MVSAWKAILGLVLSTCTGINVVAQSTTYSIITAPDAAPTASVPTVNDGRKYVEYSTVTGVFLQDDPTTNSSTFDYTKENFGLINRTYPSDPPQRGDRLTQWQRLNRYLYSLNQESPRNVWYKLLFIGRHGEGYHNAAESYYGTPAWNCYYAQYRGNSTNIWADAHLTPNGISQANLAHDFWAREIKVEKIQPPMSYYVSPLSRCLQTAEYTFRNLNLQPYYPFKPTVKEFFREGISIHKCDRRRKKSYIQSNFPGYVIEDTFTEEDEVWNGISAETSTAQDYRSKIVLDELVLNDPASIVSITTHSGEARSLLRIVKHIPFSLNTGAIIPVLIKARVRNAAAISSTITSTQPWTTSAWCTNGPPVTSQTTGNFACVCKDGVQPVATVTKGRAPAQQ